MLYTAADYKFVNTTPVASMIHGNILPIRQPTAATAQLYFENYLFLLEAYYERMNPESEGLNNISVPNVVLDSGNIRALKLQTATLGNSSADQVIRGTTMGYANDGTYYINPSATHLANVVNTGYTADSNFHLYNYLQNYLLPLPESKQPYYSMEPGGGSTARTIRLKSDYIRAKFWAFNNMSKMLIGLRFGDFATKIVHQTLKYDGSLDYEYEYGLNGTVMSGFRAYSTRTTNDNTVEYRLFKTVVTYKDSFFTFPYATSAELIWKCSVEAMGGESSETRKYVWSAKSLTTANGVIQIPLHLFESLADDACSIAGRPTNSSISFYNCYLLVDFEFPARLNGVNWSWEPTYT